MSLSLAFYGDDFTGSADVMEVLQWAGHRTVLFLFPPGPEQLLRFPNLTAFGIAGSTRSMSPLEMEQELPHAFTALRRSGADFVHYKICSTFDSSPAIGSIGKAIEIGRSIFGETPVPLLAGAPPLRRYTVFGNLFARSGLDSEPARLDRHPTMAQHPITPMTEADLRQHLQCQTSLGVGLMDVLKLESESPAAAFQDLLDQRPDIILFDVLYPRHLPVIGHLCQQLKDVTAPNRSLFMAGSSGLEYALTASWNKAGRPPFAPLPTFGPANQLLVLTGTCSPVNERQLQTAAKAGFQALPLDTPALADPTTAPSAIQSIACEAVRHLKQGANLLLHSSCGPADPRIARTRQKFQETGLSKTDVLLKSGRLLGPRFGQILYQIIDQHPLPRLGVAGGDTSGYVARELGVEALEAIAPLAPGSPLCQVHSANPLNGMEIFFKGGQVGRDDVWLTLLHGTATIKILA